MTKVRRTRAGAERMVVVVSGERRRSARYNETLTGPLAVDAESDCDVGGSGNHSWSPGGR